MANIRIRKVESDHTDHSSQGTSLTIGIDTESGETGDREGEIIVSCLKERVNISVSCHRIDLVDQTVCIVRHKTFSEDGHFTVDLYRKGTSCNDKDIGCMVFGSIR